MTNQDVPLVFVQHGFIKSPQEQQGDQRRGRCIFCGNSNHFYINVKTLKWDCKKCGKAGGAMSFIRQVYEWSLSNINPTVVSVLSKNRGIKPATFRRAKIGYNPAVELYYIPAPMLDVEGELSDLRMWSAKHRHGIMSSAGCKTFLWNAKKILSADVVWLCEGEWDGMVFDEILHEIGLTKEGEVAIAVPGAGAFKAEWARLLDGKVVRVLYDNDKAGKEGAVRLFNMLKSIVKDLKFLRWEDGRASGYDVRDLYHELMGGKKTYDAIRAMLHEFPAGIEKDSPVVSAFVKEELHGTGMPIQQVYSGFKKWLHVPDDWKFLDVMYGSILANRRPGDPLWMLFVGPPACGKTEPLISCSEAPRIRTATSMTSAALISGASIGGSGDPSLIPQLRDKVLILKDFTTILNLPAMERDEIFGILRDAYDGKTEKQFGTGVYRRYNDCFFGILAGVTPAIEQFADGCAALGERFLQYWVPLSTNLADQRKFLKKAQSNEGKEKQMQAELKQISNAVLSKEYTHTPKIPILIGERILDLAQISSLARGVVPRDRYTHDITHRAYHELGTRMTKQFLKLAIGISQFRGDTAVSMSVFDTVKYVARGSIPSGVRGVLKTLTEHGDRDMSCNEIAESVRLPAVPTVQRILQNMDALHIAQKEKKSSLVINYRMSKDVYKLISNTKFFN